MRSDEHYCSTPLYSVQLLEPRIYIVDNPGCPVLYQALRVQPNFASLFGSQGADFRDGQPSRRGYARGRGSGRGVSP
jgi:hypothetical protein